MKERKHITRKAQSIFEYIGVALVFTTVGILAFAAANNEIILRYRGSYNDVGQDTLIGRVLGANNQEPWPNGWNPDYNVVERDLNDVGYCQQLGGGEDCEE